MMKFIIKNEEGQFVELKEFAMSIDDPSELESLASFLKDVGASLEDK